MRLIGLLVALLVITGCEKTYFINTDGSGTATPLAPSNPVVDTTKIEFRVQGSANSVRVKFSNPYDGLTQTVTTLPFFTSFNTDQKTLFISLEVTPISYPLLGQPFLSAQVVVNGNLFREATSTDFLLNTLSVSGTWRK